MIISVVSGKGGAGKTTLATSIAYVLGAEFYDLDVDAPNAEYFLKPEFDSELPVNQPVPHVDESLCDLCGLCTRECRFNALIKIVKHIYLTESLCHGCGLCEKVCPQQAIRYVDSAVGTVRSGFSERLNNRVHVGDLIIGSTRGTYLISEMVKSIDPRGPVVIDGPPGNSCAAVAAIRPADFVVLVVEPTPFGIHDMRQTEQILIQMDKPYVIIANKAMGDENVGIDESGAGKNYSLAVPLDERYLCASLEGDIISRRFNDIYTGLEMLLRQEMDKL